MSRFPGPSGASVGVGRSTNPFRYTWAAGVAEATRAQAMQVRRMASEMERANIYHSALLESAQLIAERMRGHLIPKSQSGNLLSSVRVQRPALIRGTFVPAHVVVGNEQSPYAGVIQGGWPLRGIPAYPYMTWAIEDAEPETMRLMQEALDELDLAYQTRITSVRGFLTAGMRSSYVHPARHLAAQVSRVGQAQGYAAIESFVTSQVRLSRANWQKYALRHPTTGRFVSRKDYARVVTPFVEGLVS